MDFAPCPPRLDQPQTVGDCHPDHQADRDSGKPEAVHDPLPADRRSFADARTDTFAGDMPRQGSTRPQMWIQPRHHLSRNQERLRISKRRAVQLPSREIDRSACKSFAFVASLASPTVIAKLTVSNVDRLTGARRDQNMIAPVRRQAAGWLQPVKGRVGQWRR